MDAVQVLILLGLAFVAIALAYSSVPKIRKLERRVAELERRVMGTDKTPFSEADGVHRSQPD